MILAQIIKFLKQYALGHPIYVLVYAWGYFSSLFTFNIHFYSENEVQELLKQGKSLIRFGDGEINLLLGLKNHYQDFSPKIKTSIVNIIKTYFSFSCPYVLSVPGALNTSNVELKKINRFNIWMPFKSMFFLRFPKNVGYMDAHNFYRDGYFERVVAPLFFKKTIIMITNGRVIQKLQENRRLPWKDILYVETPEEGSLASREEITDAINQVLLNRVTESAVLFFALGPVGKGLIKDFSEKGFQSIDIGRGIETMFTDESIESLI